MNPQTMYWQLNRAAFDDMWDRLGSYYRKIVSRDNTHKVSLQFAESLKRETEIRFLEWQKLQEPFWPTSAENYLDR